MPCTSYLDKYMRNELYKFDKEVCNYHFIAIKRIWLIYVPLWLKVQSFYNCYEYNRVTILVQNFIANQISSIYLNSIKDRLYCGTAKEIVATRNILKDCYHVLSKALWPIVPFIIEESWSYYGKCLFNTTKLKKKYRMNKFIIQWRA